ncbi:PREDICTED: androgen-induced gene 1 protein-like isoform X1 [Polistes canadensis]|uniref:androgen-induced gene 1 protein-like isoform X1 n=1 Tax=Polistes canadensis TaxID=91411 RepID=UPI000718C3C2|nr:PREDICTED: androgen-induced gene 1 protein-like isoform X1 [Polistes canadensis]XP_014599875.1 PREDICTED: androgen-induced gene 1 protein-like isoform X1 [Polistes canadensis]XP_014599876.1 PREDICTED: androgen-induced gene 1 protein-like isoform X1 [Polistes canadensis]XP_014599877.1 PREDICTED: androgen-induced gene 1 protein-like isoform X1 [Polistes canadensis]XP_014599878.1 PREDICTED: androgen-induced gene 1 protein-like isoform X1 [Polistes canadensis]XP_014599879.1 PREDICTED: androgen-
MRDSILIGFHAIACLQFAYSVYYDFTYTVVPTHIMKSHSAFGGRFKFLTFWDAILQAVFFLICIINDFYGTNAVAPKKPPFIRKLKDYLFGALCFPLAMFVGITFWALMFIDRELVLPKALDPYFPWWLNHLMHTMIMVSIVIELLLAPRKYPKRSHALSGLIGFTLTYLVWVHVIYYKNGIWVYPVMEVLTPAMRLVFFGILLIFTLLLYFTGEMLNKLVWGNGKTKQHKSHSK